MVHVDRDQHRPARYRIRSVERSQPRQVLLGTFAGHGRALTVQSDGAAFVTYRTYTWCSQGPPPCDDVQDGQIIGGGNLTIQFTSATPTVASGQIVSNTDPIYPLGAAVSLTLTTNDTVDLR